MEDKNILIAIVLIVLIALIGFNFEKVTGETIRHQIPIASAYKTNFPEQNEVKAGEKITVQVQVGDFCVDPEIGFYFGGITYAGEKTTSGGRKGTVTQKGHFKLCKGDVTLDSRNRFEIEYQTKPEWDGDHYARIYYYNEPDGDRTHKDYINVYFKVKPQEK